MVSITMKPDKVCKGSIRFATDDEDAPITNVYVSKTVEGIQSAQAITIHMGLGAQPSDQDKALLAAIGG